MAALPYRGLTEEEAAERQKRYGKNTGPQDKKESVLKKICGILSEPMFLLLMAAAVIYFVLGEPRDGAIMFVFVLGMITIDVVQEWKTDRTLAALKELSAPHVTVIRDGVQKTIASADLVPGDIIFISEGVKLPADGTVLAAYDLCVDESSLTGESVGVWKTARTSEEKAEGHAGDDYWRSDACYAGTLVTQGSGYLCVEKIGTSTEYGKIGAQVSEAQARPTPLQLQTGKLVKFCAIFAAILFVLITLITFFNSKETAFTNRLVAGILSGVTLAMAMIPEEFPVILTVFLSMGAFRLAKKNSLVRHLPSVETLGNVSVLCVDKTGTITQNRMTVEETWPTDGDEAHLCEVMGLGCETNAYDPMEKAMLDYCETLGITREHLFAGRMLEEYSFTDELKMMGHVWRHDGEIIAAIKGSPEQILGVSILSEAMREKALETIQSMSQKGLRVIAVGEMHLMKIEQIPEKLTDCRLELRGLVGLWDPPRETVRADISECQRAGIRVVMITGDYSLTAKSIAQRIGMPATEVVTGRELDGMTEQELRERVRTVNLFSRVVPEHKMRIVKAFQANGEVVAMTGDGVNDAPALKHADIGISMGKRGSDVSKEAADLILLDDNFSTIVETVHDGRRIFDNIRKAIGYVFAIHIPIAFASLVAPLLRIDPENLMLLPLHVVLLELVIDPTCSIVLERQPAERNLMDRAPRKKDDKILTKGLLVKSVIQGLVIFVVSFYTYLSFLPNAALARASSLVILVFSSLFLVQVNSSERDFFVQTVRFLARDRVMWIVNLAMITGLILILYTPLCTPLKLVPLSAVQFFAAIGLAFAAVFWYEVVKAIRKIIPMIRRQ